MYTENKKQHEIQTPNLPYRISDYDEHLLRQLNVSTPVVAIGATTSTQTNQDANIFQNIATFIVAQLLIRLLLRIITRR
jgi:hypothetical protein